MTYKIKQLNERTTKGMATVDTTVHDYLILAAMSSLDVPVEVADIINVLSPNYTTHDPLPKSVKWHLNKLVKEGVVERIDEQPTTPVEPVTKPKRTKKIKQPETPVVV
jgi:hypothetical protein